MSKETDIEKWAEGFDSVCKVNNIDSIKLLKFAGFAEDMQSGLKEATSRRSRRSTKVLLIARLLNAIIGGTSGGIIGNLSSAGGARTLKGIGLGAGAGALGITGPLMSLGGAIGASVGSGRGETDEEKQRNALIGGLAGTGIGAVPGAIIGGILQ